MQATVCVCRPTGAVRVSFGWMSSVEDVEAILTFLKTCFLDSAGGPAPTSDPESTPVPTNTSLLGTVSHVVDQLSTSKHRPNPVRVDAHCSTALPLADEQNRHRFVHNSSGDSSRPVTISHTQQTLNQALVTSSQAAQADSAQMQAAMGQCVPSRLHDGASPGLTTWLQQLPWVRCGDSVSAWTASEAELHRQASHAHASTSTSNSNSYSTSTSKANLAQPLQSGITARMEPAAQPALVSQRWPQPHTASASRPEQSGICVQPSVLHSEAQHDPYTSSSMDPQAGMAGNDNLDSASACRQQGSLEGIWVYPIKSCGGIRVTDWPLGPNGLLLDREWALVGDDGHVLTQKGLPRLALVQPRVDLAQGTLQVLVS